MKRLIVAVAGAAAALLAANYLLVVVAIIAVLSVLTFLIRLAGVLNRADSFSQGQALGQQAPAARALPG